MQATMQDQYNIEESMYSNGIHRFDTNNERMQKQGEESSTAWYRRLTKSFVQPLAEAIVAYIDYYSDRRGKPSKSLYYLKSIQPEVAAYITIKVVFDSFQHDDSVQNIAIRIASRIEDQIRFTRLSSDAPNYVLKVKKSLAKNATSSYKFSKDVLVHTEGKLADSEFEVATEVRRWMPWSATGKLQLGSKLIDMFMEVCLYRDKPIVEKHVRYSTAKRGKVGNHNKILKIRPTESIINWIIEFQDEISGLSPLYAPCLVQPRDWTSPTDGGYHSKEISSTLTLVKTRNRRHLAKLTPERMPVFYDAVNILQKTAYRIADRVHRVAEEVLVRDLALAIPGKEKLKKTPAPVPESLSDLRGMELKDAMTDEQWQAFKSWKKEASTLYDMEIERRGQYLEASRTIAQAGEYKKFDELYFAYTADFRQRLYTCSSLLDPQGGDLQKGMLRFKKKEHLGVNGYKWLAVQGASAYGNDKLSFNERVAFIESITEDILDIAANPIAFRGWVGVDKPWQYLNFCYEWADLTEFIRNGGHHSEYQSDLICWQDGSCSGIQHYSAILRDPVGGSAVNLLYHDRPQDIYAEVAAVVEARMRAIASGKPAVSSAGNPLFEKMDRATLVNICNAWLTLGIERNLTKKAVMTLPYGSTQITCRDSITAYLDKLQDKENKKAKSEGRRAGMGHPFSDKRGAALNRTKAETVASQLVWDSISDVVKAARVGMKFIKDVTKMVTDEGKPLEWVTPTGFIVEQAIYETKATRVTTQLMGRTDFILREPTDVIDRARMKTSAAPNFIHSMDASHLCFSVNGMRQEGIDSIATNHDAFGTHAGNVDISRRVLAVEFVNMYENHNVFQEFKDHNEDKQCVVVDTVVPEPMGLDLQDVLKSEYLFG